jgi:hypothetical protein
MVKSHASNEICPSFAEFHFAFDPAQRRRCGPARDFNQTRAVRQADCPGFLQTAALLNRFPPAGRIRES